jgi:heme exporter protein D
MSVILRYWSLVDMSECCCWCDPSSAGTLTHVNPLEYVCWARFATDCTYAIYIWQSFLLVRTVRSYVNVIKLPNPINKTAILTILIIAKFETVEESDFRQSAKAPHGCYLWMAITIIVIIKIICMSRHQKAEQAGCKSVMKPYQDSHFLGLKPEKFTHTSVLSRTV